MRKRGVSFCVCVNVTRCNAAKLCWQFCVVAVQDCRNPTLFLSLFSVRTKFLLDGIKFILTDVKGPSTKYDHFMRVCTNKKEENENVLHLEISKITLNTYYKGYNENF